MVEKKLNVNMSLNKKIVCFFFRNSSRSTIVEKVETFEIKTDLSGLRKGLPRWTRTGPTPSRSSRRKSVTFGSFVEVSFLMICWVLKTVVGFVNKINRI